MTEDPGSSRSATTERSYCISSTCQTPRELAHCDLKASPPGEGKSSKYSQGCRWSSWDGSLSISFVLQSEEMPQLCWRGGPIFCPNSIQNGEKELTVHQCLHRSWGYELYENLSKTIPLEKIYWVPTVWLKDTSRKIPKPFETAELDSTKYRPPATVFSFLKK